MSNAAELLPPSPWHEGELAMQRSAGSADKLATRGHLLLRDHLIDQHRQFYPQLPFIVAGAVDGTGDAWATILSGKPGFLQSPDPYRLSIAAARHPNDPADGGMNDGNAVGLLGIELHTRRRNRLNGLVRRTDAQAFDVLVQQSFGNCPQYIQLRDFAFVRNPAMTAPEVPRELPRLDDRARAMITGADTFFVASYVEDAVRGRAVDVSHRGGRPGFVRIGADGVLTIPDFSGNRFFNTLGNLIANPRSGLLFVDFETGDLLQLTGDAKVILDSPEIARLEGAERLWRLTPRRILYRPDGLSLRWRFQPDGWSPQSLRTGTWKHAGDQAGR
jgi:predicted pyridoxine 5'-phosphate oxidase superfamily flavin-nucleotide-binding protein